MESPKLPRYYLLTYPRSASNLFTKILALENQSSVVSRPNSGYFFLPTAMNSHQIGTRGISIDDWTLEQKARTMQCYKTCIQDLVDYVETSEAAGNSVFIKEHATLMSNPTAISESVVGQANVKESDWVFQIPGMDNSKLTHSALNRTVLPDEFLATFSPTFLVRHPALSFPSMFRAFRDVEGDKSDEDRDSFRSVMTLKWTRALYDWYGQNLSQERAQTVDPEVTWPIVIEADDIMTQPSVLTRFCEITGMDPTKLRYEWNAATPREMGHSGGKGDEIAKRMLSTISASNSVLKGKTSEGLDIATEAEKWRQEFHVETANMIEQLVREAMPDYEYLKAKRLRPKSL